MLLNCFINAVNLYRYIRPITQDDVRASLSHKAYLSFFALLTHCCRLTVLYLASWQ